MNVHSSTVFIIAVAETTQISISQGTDKSDVESTYSGTLFGHKKEWSSDTGHDMMNLENMLSVRSQT